LYVLTAVKNLGTTVTKRNNLLQMFLNVDASFDVLWPVQYKLIWSGI